MGLLDDVSGDFLIASHRVYSSFGLLTDEDASGSPGPLRASIWDYDFTARFTDPLTGMTHHQFRWYDAQLGKWISEDPLGFAAGDINTTRYVANAPLSYTDPTGLIAVSIAGGNNDAGNGGQDPQQFTDDEQRLINLANGDPHVLREVNDLLDVADQTGGMRWRRHSCIHWTQCFRVNRIEGDVYPYRRLVVDAVQWDWTGPGFWQHHVAVRVRFPSGEIAYLDNEELVGMTMYSFLKMSMISAGLDNQQSRFPLQRLQPPRHRMF